MNWEIKLEPKAEKDLNKIPDKYRKKILVILPEIAINPFAGKKLNGKLDGLYSYRVWPYRIIYKVYKKLLLIMIIRIGHRGKIYSYNEERR